MPALQKTSYSGCVLVQGADTVLLQKRDADPGISNPGVISTFGGKIEPGETPRQSLRRELHEELSLSCNDDDFAFIGYIERYQVEKNSVVACWYYYLQLDSSTTLECSEGALVPLSLASDLSRDALIGPITLEMILRCRLLRALAII